MYFSEQDQWSHTSNCTQTRWGNTPGFRFLWLQGLQQGRCRLVTHPMAAADSTSPSLPAAGLLLCTPALPKARFPHSSTSSRHMQLSHAVNHTQLCAQLSH